MKAEAIVYHSSTGFTRQYAQMLAQATGLPAPEEADVSRLARSSHLGDRPLFYLRGGYAPDRVKGLSKIMMTPILLSAKHAAAKGDPKAEALMEVLIHGVDWVSREQLQPVLDWLEQP